MTWWFVFWSLSCGHVACPHIQSMQNYDWPGEPDVWGHEFSTRKECDDFVEDYLPKHSDEIALWGCVQQKEIDNLERRGP